MPPKAKQYHRVPQFNVYGMVGVHAGRLPFILESASTTSVGRNEIVRQITELRSKYTLPMINYSDI